LPSIPLNRSTNFIELINKWSKPIHTKQHIN